MEKDAGDAIHLKSISKNGLSHRLRVNDTSRSKTSPHVVVRRTTRYSGLLGNNDGAETGEREDEREPVPDTEEEAEKQDVTRSNAVKVPFMITDDTSPNGASGNSDIAGAVSGSSVTEWDGAPPSTMAWLCKKELWREEAVVVDGGSGGGAPTEGAREEAKRGEGSCEEVPAGITAGGNVMGKAMV